MTDTDDGTQQLYMLQMRLPMKGLTEIGKMHGLPLKYTDDNYLTHCALGKLFQNDAPKPYALGKRDGKHVRVLGYASTSADDLQQQAQAFAEPSVYDRCFDWDYFASKPMPESFPTGMKLGFKTRVCPVIRKSSAGKYEAEDGSVRSWREGQELDAFLAEAWKTENDGVELDRETIYSDWLNGHFDRRGGVELIQVSMKRFSIERMTRRSHGDDRKVKQIQRPDTTMEGTLRITDGNAFSTLLQRGIGRHKSFGFGMLKVRPV